VRVKEVIDRSTMMINASALIDSRAYVLAAHHRRAVHVLVCVCGHHSTAHLLASTSECSIDFTEDVVIRHHLPSLAHCRPYTSTAEQTPMIQSLLIRLEWWP